MADFRRLLLGRRLASDETHHTKISNPIGLAVFSSDALSSVAYGTQEIMASLSMALGHGGAADRHGAGRHGRVRAGGAGGHRHRHPPGPAGLQLPADHHGIPGRRRRLHRGQGEPGRDGGPDRRRLAAHRLRAHRGGVGVFRRGRHHRRRAGPGRLQRGPLPAVPSPSSPWPTCAGSRRADGCSPFPPTASSPASWSCWPSASAAGSSAPR